MKIYTGNFANSKKYQAAGLKPISIARNQRFWKFDEIKELATPLKMKKMEEHEFTPKFNQILARLQPQQIFEAIEKISEGKDVVLLCFEREGEFCHRQLVAKWLQENLQIEVKELGQMKQTLF